MTASTARTVTREVTVDVAGWGAMLADALRETGGPLTDAERGLGG